MEETTHDWEFSWTLFLAIVGPAIVITIGVIINAFKKEFEAHDKKVKEQRRATKATQRQAEEQLGKAIIAARQSTSPQTAKTYKVDVQKPELISYRGEPLTDLPTSKPKPETQKRRAYSDEVPEHKESFLDKLLGRVPQSE